MVAIVRLLFYGISLVGMSLEVCVLWRMLRTRQWRVFPFFFSYMCYLFAGTLVLSTMFQIMGLTAGTKNSLYGDLYWGIETAGIALRFLIIWEVFRHLFPQGTSLNRIVSRKFAWAAAGLVVFAMGSVLELRDLCAGSCRLSRAGSLFWICSGRYGFGNVADRHLL